MKRETQPSAAHGSDGLEVPRLPPRGVAMMLRFKVNIAILLTYLGIVVVFAMIELPHQQRALATIVHHNEILLQSIVDRDEQRLANEIFEDRSRAMALRREEMRKVEGIKAIAVFDRHGKWLVEAGDGAGDDLALDDQPIFPEKAQVSRQASEAGDLLVFVRSIDAAGERVGLIRVLLSLAEISRQQQMSYRIFVGVLAGILAVMLVLLNTLMTRVVIRPIATLRHAMSRLQGGALGTQLPVAGHDEISELTKTFNHMSADLAASYQEIESRNRELAESGARLSEERERLAQMRVYLKNIFNSMPSILVAIDEQGIIEEWTEAAARIIGVPVEAAVGRPIWTVLPSMERYRRAIGEVLASKSPREFHREILADTGSEEYFNVSLFPLVANCLQGIVIRVDNITELESKERQLRHAQKMETIGTLAGGLAHDFNNILGGITGSLSLIRFKLEQDRGIDLEFLDTYLRIMEQAGSRASELMRQLLSITRRQEIALQPVDLNQSVAQVIGICSISFDKSVAISSSGPSRGAMVKADPAQLEQVLLNLLVNAAHAMTTMRAAGEKQGGELTVAIDRLVADHAFCQTHVEAQPIPYWVVSIQDTGVGMEPRVMAKIFDPFFTTKGKGKGTGLGLAMVYNIVQQHGGFLDVYSESGKGSTFRVYLPVCDVSPATVEVDDDEPMRGQGLVLVVDDEEMILKSLRRLLSDLDVRVLTADGGEPALELLRQNDVALIISDQRMPGMDGVEFLRQSREIAPEAVRILLTGYADVNASIGAINSGEVKYYLSKPWDDDQFLSRVKESLEMYWVRIENRRLHELTARQNAELKDLNATLEQRVLEQTAEIQMQHRELRQSFMETIKAFSTFVELRYKDIGSHSQWVATLVKKVIDSMEVDKKFYQDVILAAFLHDIGKIVKGRKVAGNKIRIQIPFYVESGLPHPLKPIYIDKFEIKAGLIFQLPEVKNAKN